MPSSTRTARNQIPMQSLPLEESQLRGTHYSPPDDRRAQDNSRTSRDPSASNILISRSPIGFSLKELCLHTLSVTCSILIIILCAKRVYFKDIDAHHINTQLNALQLVAALHGALVALSLGAMAVDHMLYELCRDEGLPLGYIILPFQLSSILIPFRASFWRATFSRRITMRKILFGALVLLAVGLQALIGPASAILIVPQLEFWDYQNPFGSTDGFTFFNQSHDSMWPLYINASLVDVACNVTGVLMPEQCPYANLAQIRSWGADYRDQFSASNITSVDDGNQIRYVSSSPPDHDRPGYSASTTVMAHVARDFGNIWSYAERHRIDKVPFGAFRRPKLFLLPGQSDKQIMRPLVQTQCAAPVDITNSTNEDFPVSFPGDFVQGAQGQTFNNITAMVNTTHYHERPIVSDFQDLSAEAGKPAVGVVFGLRFTNADHVLGHNFSSENGTGLIACSIAAHWVPTNLSSDPTMSNIVTMDNLYPEIAAGDSNLKSPTVPITFDLAYLDKVNVQVTNNNANVLEYNTRGLAVRGSRYRYYDGTWGSQWPWILSTLTTVQLSDALSRVNLDSRMKIFCQGCGATTEKSDPQASSSSINSNEVQDLFAQNMPENTYSESRTASEFKADIISHSDRFVTVQWKVQRYGYSWGLDRITKWLALAVLVTHSLLVVAHTILSAIRRTKFEAWADFPEFLALVNQSRALDVLHEFGVGIVDEKKYAKNVFIRAIPTDEHGRQDQAMLTTAENFERVKTDKLY